MGPSKTSPFLPDWTKRMETVWEWCARLSINTNGYFTDLVTPKGPGAPSLPFTGFGLAFADFDNDGNLDLYVANGKVKRGRRDFDLKDPYAEPNTLLRGWSDGDF